MALINQTSQAYYDGNDFGNYQFTSLDNIINQFIIAYVGEDKIISKISRADIKFLKLQIHHKTFYKTLMEISHYKLLEI